MEAIGFHTFYVYPNHILLSLRSNPIYIPIPMLGDWWWTMGFWFFWLRRELRQPQKIDMGGSRHTWSFLYMFLCPKSWPFFRPAQVWSDTQIVNLICFSQWPVWPSATHFNSARFLYGPSKTSTLSTLSERLSSHATLLLRYESQDLACETEMADVHVAP